MSFDGFTEVGSQSSHVTAAKYDSFDRKLTIRFRNGSEYTYHGVTPQDHQNFMDASSHGEHFHRFIKDQYPSEQVK